MDIVIVGNGVAGIACALAARQRDAKARITVVSGESDYFFSRTALMYAYMDVMSRRNLEPYERGVYERQRIERVRDWVVDLNADDRKIRLESGGELRYDRLVLAVGARAKMFPWEGVDAVRDGLVHFVSMQDLDTCERLTPTTREAVVVGGGLIGIELVESLRHHGVKVTFLVREPYYWPMALAEEESQLVTEHIRAHGVEVALTEEMERVDVDEAGRVRSVETSLGRTLPCQMLGIAAGVRPNIERLASFTDAPELEQGVVVDEYLATSLPGVYACGDCAWIRPSDGSAPFGEQIWYSAKRQGELVGRNIFGDRVRYERPIFFNSSKFFDIEYTTVGEVVNLPEGATSLYRRRPGQPISQRIVSLGDRVIGFNMLGSRWDHALLIRWVDERRSPAWVAEHLADAQFDVEFGRAAIEDTEEKLLPLARGSGR